MYLILVCNVAICLLTSKHFGTKTKNGSEALSPHSSCRLCKQTKLARSKESIKTVVYCGRDIVCKKLVGNIVGIKVDQRVCKGYKQKNSVFAQNYCNENYIRNLIHSS